MNNVFLIGRLTKDPQTKYGADSQKAYCKVTIAIDRGKDKDGNDLMADFPSVVCFGKTAENLERFTKKGNLIAVAGEIRTGKYEGKDGKTVYTTDVYANRIEFLEWADKADKPSKPKQEQGQIFCDDDIPF